MNRRDFVKSGAGLLAGASLPGAVTDARIRAGSDGEQASAPTGVDFDCSGLFAFRLKQDKELRLMLINAKKASLDDDHAPVLMMPLEAYDPDGIESLRRHDPPNIVRLGGDPKRTLAVWSLVGLNVWVDNAHGVFEGNDPNASLKFDTTPIDPTKDPNPLNKDEGWASLYWFASLPDLLTGTSSRAAGPLNCDNKKIESTIRLTQGDASGRCPATACEQNRKYWLDDDFMKKRSYATQLHVAYKCSGVLRLAVASPKISNTPNVSKLIGIKASSGLTPVTIANLPMTHVSNAHYRAFYKVVGKKGRELKHTDPCWVEELRGLKAASKSAHATAHGEMREYPDDRAAPYPDCIPPHVPGD